MGTIMTTMMPTTAVIKSTCFAAATFAMALIAMYGTSFQATARQQTAHCDVSSNMLEFHHCIEGSYEISDFWEWARKGTLRSRFCGLQMACVSMTYAAAILLGLTFILGCLLACGGKLQQLCVSIAHTSFAVLVAGLCVAIPVLWTWAKSALPDLTLSTNQTSVYESSGQPGSEWSYLPGDSGAISWDLGWAVFIGYANAVCAIAAAVCAFLNVKNLISEVVIRIDLKGSTERSGVHQDRFLDAAIITTGAIMHTDALAGITTSPPPSPTRLQVISADAEASGHASANEQQVQEQKTSSMAQL